MPKQHVSAALHSISWTDMVARQAAMAHLLPSTTPLLRARQPPPLAIHGWLLLLLPLLRRRANLSRLPRHLRCPTANG